MAIPTGLAAQLGVKEEVTYGTAVTVDRFFEFNSESLSTTIERMESQGLRAGQRVLRSDRWKAGLKTVEGSVELEVHSTGFGFWLEQALGGVVTTNPGTTAYLHVFTPGDLPEGFTMQIGRPSNDGTVRAFTYEGCRINSWELSADVGSLLMFSADVIAEDEVTDTALATASYNDDELLTFVHGSLTIGGSAVDVTSFSLAGANNLAARNRLGAQVTKKPLETSWREYTGSIEAYFDDLDLYNLYVNGTVGQLVLTFNLGTDSIESGHDYELIITAEVRYDGDTPQVSGTEELMQTLSFKVVEDVSDDDSLSISYKTTDATP